MLVETGRVAKSAQGKALVEIVKGTACAECHVGSACDLGKSVRTVEANDPFGVRVDQLVQVSVPNDSVLRASFVVYIIPLLALIAGTLFGEYLGGKFGVQNIFEIIGGFTCLGLSFLFVRFYNNIFKEQIRNQPVITKIIG